MASKHWTLAVPKVGLEPVRTFPTLPPSPPYTSGTCPGSKDPVLFPNGSLFACLSCAMPCVCPVCISTHHSKCVIQRVPGEFTSVCDCAVGGCGDVASVLPLGVLDKDASQAEDIWGMLENEVYVGVVTRMMLGFDAGSREIVASADQLGRVPLTTLLGLWSRMYPHPPSHTLSPPTPAGLSRALSTCTFFRLEKAGSRDGGMLSLRSPGASHIIQLAMDYIGARIGSVESILLAAKVRQLTNLSPLALADPTHLHSLIRDIASSSDPSLTVFGVRSRRLRQYEMEAMHLGAREPFDLDAIEMPHPNLLRQFEAAIKTIANARRARQISAEVGLLERRVETVRATDAPVAKVVDTDKLRSHISKAIEEERVRVRGGRGGIGEEEEEEDGEFVIEGGGEAEWDMMLGRRRDWTEEVVRSGERLKEVWSELFVKDERKVDMAGGYGVDYGRRLDVAQNRLLMIRSTPSPSPTTPFPSFLTITPLRASATTRCVIDFQALWEDAKRRGAMFAHDEAPVGAVAPSSRRKTIAATASATIRSGEADAKIAAAVDEFAEDVKPLISLLYDPYWIKVCMNVAVEAAYLQELPTPLLLHHTLCLTTASIDEELDDDTLASTISRTWTAKAPLERSHWLATSQLLALCGCHWPLEQPASRPTQHKI